MGGKGGTVKQKEAVGTNGIIKKGVTQLEILLYSACYLTLDLFRFKSFCSSAVGSHIKLVFTTNPLPVQNWGSSLRHSATARLVSRVQGTR